MRSECKLKLNFLMWIGSVDVFDLHSVLYRVLRESITRDIYKLKCVRDVPLMYIRLIEYFLRICT